MGATAYVGGRVYNFTLNAGRGNAQPGNGNLANGYWTSSGSGGGWTLNYGSISNEPIPGLTLAGFNQTDYSLTYIGIYFFGSVVAQVAGLRLFINGVNYPFTTDWSVAAIGGAGVITTRALTDDLSPVILNGGSYPAQLRR